MGSFDATKAYQAEEKETPFFDDGREIELLHFVYGHPKLSEIRGSPEKVIDAIDEFGRTKKYLMNVGDDKGRIVSNLVKEHKPEIMVELGGYIGYSALLFGSAVRDNGGSRYFSLERNPEFGAVIMSLADLAGLSDVVKVMVGSSTESIKRLHGDGSLKHIDMMFLDHYKPAYTSDLKLCESLGLVGPGTLLAADNVIKPGNPPYLEYVRSSVEKKRKRIQEGTPARDDAANFGNRTKAQYKNRVAEEQLETEARGNPNLVYESRLEHSFEPTGVPDGIEISKCVKEEAAT